MKYIIISVENPNYLFLKINSDTNEFKKYISDKIIKLCQRLLPDYKLEENFFDFPMQFAFRKEELEKFEREKKVLLNTSFIGGLLCLGVIVQDSNIDLRSYKEQLNKIYLTELEVFKAVHSYENEFKEIVLFDYLENLQNLKKLCLMKIKQNISLFKKHLNSLPLELQQEIDPTSETVTKLVK